jgi:polysaccharide deacetylase 2 family uncharacterized protein YibQ
MHVELDDLSAPLGKTPPKPPRIALKVTVPHIFAAALALVALVIAGRAMFAEDPLGGEPMAVVPVNLRLDAAGNPPEEVSPRPVAGNAERPNRYDGPSPSAADPSAPAVPPGGRTVTIIDGSSGKRQEVVIPGSSDNRPAALDERLTEASRHGPLPKVAQDGARPADVYARPAKAVAGKPNAPRVAIVIGGLGIGAASTGDALIKLPGPITFAFSPYGGDLALQVVRARDAGHEILLQVPMEPFDYPDNDPGPQTLLTSLDTGQNIDRLQWLMSRFQGYVGIANAMGGRFSASEQALAPVLREAAKRGLIYIDDGSSTRSLASQIAGAHNLAFAKADLVVDTVPAAADVDRALARLEAIARDRGIAVGMASALPVSIERIARWAKAAESRGLLLVPISAAVARAKSS